MQAQAQPPAHNTPLSDALSRPEKTLAIAVDLRASLQRWLTEMTPLVRNAKAGLTILLFRSELPEWALGEPFCSHPLETSENLLSREDKEHMDSEAQRWAREWYQNAFATEDEIATLGKVFGCAIEMNFLRFIIPRLKNGIVFRRWLSRHRADALFIFDDTNELWEAAALATEKSDTHLYREYGVCRRSFPHINFERQRDSFPRPNRNILHGIVDRLARRRLLRKAPVAGWALLDPSFMEGEKCRFPLQGPAPLLFSFSRGLRQKILLLRRRATYLPLDLGGPRSSTQLPPDWPSRIGAALEPLAQYEDLHFGPLLRDYLAMLARRFYPRVSSADSMLRQLNSRACIRLAAVPTDVKHNPKLVVLLCRALGISTATIQHGALGETSGWGVLNSDRIAVWGEESRQWYGGRNGLERCRITGYPPFENLKSWIQKNPTDFSIPSRRILFISQAIHKSSTFSTYDELECILRACLRALPGVTPAELIVRPHPREVATAAYQGLLAEYPHVEAMVDASTPLWPLIRSSAAVVVRASTVGLEAMLLRVPVILVNFSPRPDMAPFAERGAAIGAHSQEELGRALHIVLSENSERRDLIQRAERFARDYVSFDVDSHVQFGNFLTEVAQNLTPVTADETSLR